MKTSLIFTLIVSLAISCTATKNLNHEEQYCIVVEEVKHNKHNAFIRPKSQVKDIKRLNMWYRYPSVNVSPGDTVDVSVKQLITGPRF
jgi:hypothetical protein